MSSSSGDQFELDPSPGDVIDTQRARTFSWKCDRHHLLIAVFRKHFNDTNSNLLLQLFNHVFAKDLRRCGLPDGLRKAQLTAQIADINRSHICSVWNRVSQLSLSESREVHSQIKNKLEDVAVELDIILQLRTDNQPCPSSSNSRSAKRPRRQNHSPQVLETMFAQSGSEHEFLQSCRSKRAKAVKSTSDNPITPAKKRRHSPESALCNTLTKAHRFRAIPAALQLESSQVNAKFSDRFPKLAFRWYDSTSQGVNTAHDFRAALPQRTPTRQDFFNHLSTAKVPTPFISFFTRLLPPVQRAMSSSSPTATLAIIDLEATERHLLTHHPHLGTGAIPEVLFRVKDIVLHRYGFHLRSNYYGPCEVLVLGSVPASAILATIPIAKLKAAAQRDPGILHLPLLHTTTIAAGLVSMLKACSPVVSYDTGLALGRIFRDILPVSLIEYVPSLANKVGIQWRFRGFHRCLSRNKPRVYAEYHRGVWDGFTGDNTAQQALVALPVVGAKCHETDWDSDSNSDTNADTDTSSDNGREERWTTPPQWPSLTHVEDHQPRTDVLAGMPTKASEQTPNTHTPSFELFTGALRSEPSTPGSDGFTRELRHFASQPSHPPPHLRPTHDNAQLNNQKTGSATQGGAAPSIATIDLTNERDEHEEPDQRAEPDEDEEELLLLEPSVEVDRSQKRRGGRSHAAEGRVVGVRGRRSLSLAIRAVSRDWS